MPSAPQKNISLPRPQHIFLLILQLVMVITATALLVYQIQTPGFSKTGGIIASFLLPFLPNLISFVFKAKISFSIQLTYLLFLFVSLFLGIDFDLYKTVPFFDKAVHFASGILIVIVAGYALKFFKADTTKRSFQILFIVAFGISIAVLWEFFEFFCDKLLGQSMQQLVSIGVDDTMYDLLIATIGSLLGAIILTKPTKKQK